MLSCVYAEFVLSWPENSLPTELLDFWMPTLTKLHKHEDTSTKNSVDVLLLVGVCAAASAWNLCRMIAQAIHKISKKNMSSMPAWPDVTIRICRF